MDWNFPNVEGIWLWTILKFFILNQPFYIARILPLSLSTKSPWPNKSQAFTFTPPQVVVVSFPHTTISFLSLLSIWSTWPKTSELHLLHLQLLQWSDAWTDLDSLSSIWIWWILSHARSPQWKLLVLNKRLFEWLRFYWFKRDRG